MRREIAEKRIRDIAVSVRIPMVITLIPALPAVRQLCCPECGRQIGIGEIIADRNIFQVARKLFGGGGPPSRTRPRDENELRAGAHHLLRIRVRYLLFHLPSRFFCLRRLFRARRICRRSCGCWWRKRIRKERGYRALQHKKSIIEIHQKLSVSAYGPYESDWGALSAFRRLEHDVALRIEYGDIDGVLGDEFVVAFNSNNNIGFERGTIVEVIKHVEKRSVLPKRNWNNFIGIGLAGVDIEFFLKKR